MAADAKSIEAGNAFVRIWANMSDLEKGLNDAKQRLSAFSGALGTLGSALALTFATSKITGWISSFAEGGRELFLMARAAGISVDEISELKAALKNVEGNLEGTVNSMRKMGIFLHDAATGGREASDALSQLGLSLADVANLSEIDKLQLIGERLAAIGNVNTRQALGRQIFGREGGATVGIAGQLGAARAEAREKGITSAEDIRRAFELSKAFEDLETATKGVGKTIAGLLAPAFIAVTKSMIGAADQVRAWVKENGELIQKIVLVGSFAVAASTAILGLATAIKLAGFAVAGVAAVFTGLWAAVSSLAAIIVLPFAQLGIAAIAIPAAIYGLGKVTGAFEALGNAAAHLRDIFNTTFAGIKDAIALGDLGKAWEIMIAGMKVAWLDFRVWLAEETRMPTAEEINPAIAVGRRHRQIITGQQGFTITERPAATPEMQALRDQQAAARDQLRALANSVNTSWIAEQDRQLQGLPNMADVADQLGQGAARSTFNRDVLFGFGGTPMQQLITSTKAIVDQLGPILYSIDEGVRLINLEVG